VIVYRWTSFVTNRCADSTGELVSWRPLRLGTAANTTNDCHLALSTGDIELAVEGVDEACSRALERWKRISAMESPTGWVYRVAINHARRVARRRSMEQRFFESKCQCPTFPPRWRDLEVSRVTVGTSTTSCHVASRRRNERERDWHGVGISRGTVQALCTTPSAIGPPARRRKRTLGDYACHN